MKFVAAIISTPLLLLADLGFADDDISKYSLTDSDLTAIIEETQRLGVDTSLPVLDLTAKWRGDEHIQATFLIQVGETTGRAIEVTNRYVCSCICTYDNVVRNA